jgi:dTDP-4-dehydrorhamnose 3,5-epimerase
VIFTPAPLPGLFVVEPEPQADARGLFARTFDVDSFARHGLCTTYVQCSTSFNARAGTLRGLHYQAEPHAEAKLVRVTRGAAFDVVVDLRPASGSFRRWFGIELSADNRRQLYVPPGFAHGFQTLTDDTEVYYQISPAYVPDAARGVRWDDPAFAIVWPDAPARILSERDRGYPDFGSFR